jgi:hypothetical protein
MRRLDALACIGGGLERHLLPRTVNAPVDLSVCDAPRSRLGGGSGAA